MRLERFLDLPWTLIWSWFYLPPDSPLTHPTTQPWTHPLTFHRPTPGPTHGPSAGSTLNPSLRPPKPSLDLPLRLSSDPPLDPPWTHPSDSPQTHPWTHPGSIPGPPAPKPSSDPPWTLDPPLDLLLVPPLWTDPGSAALRLLAGESALKAAALNSLKVQK